MSLSLPARPMTAPRSGRNLTPVQEAALRQQVLEWLTNFASDTERYLVLDYDWHLCSEYRNKLTEQDYGWLAIMGKLDRNEIVWIGLTVDTDGHAVLPRDLAKAVADLADRKIVAAALAALKDQRGCRITNACDTDWLDCSDVLARIRHRDRARHRTLVARQMDCKEKAVMVAFFRFPHTPHLAWLGEGAPRDDKVLSPAEARELLADDVVIEEKLDGANLGISLDPAGGLRLQNRGQYLVPPFREQFSRAAGWLAQHAHALAPVLGPDLILFGEWCAARHSVCYDHLSDWFLAFDVYDRPARRFWSTARRDALVKALGLALVPCLARRRMTLEAVKALVMTSTSRFGDTPLEGVVVRREGPDFLDQRAKLVRPDFAQAIAEHWRSRRIEWNAVSHT